MSPLATARTSLASSSDASWLHLSVAGGCLGPLVPPPSGVQCWGWRVTQGSDRKRLRRVFDLHPGLRSAAPPGLYNRAPIQTPVVALIRVRSRFNLFGCGHAAIGYDMPPLRGQYSILYGAFVSIQIRGMKRQRGTIAVRRAERAITVAIASAQTLFRWSGMVLRYYGEP